MKLVERFENRDQMKKDLHWLVRVFGADSKLAHTIRTMELLVEVGEKRKSVRNAK